MEPSLDGQYPFKINKWHSVVFSPLKVKKKNHKITQGSVFMKRKGDY